MRIGVVSSQIFPCPPRAYSGLEMIAYQQAKGLAKRGHQVLVFAPDGSRVEGCQVHHTGPPGAWDEKKAYSTYWQHLLELEVIIDNSWSKQSLLLKMEGRLQAPVLMVMHAPINTMLQSPPPVPKPCVVCISEDQASHYRALFNQDCRVCYNGVDTGYYKPMHIKRSDRFLFLARFSRIKGADVAIRACLEAGVGLDLVGDTSITNEPDYLQECFNLARHKSPGWDESLKGQQIRIHGGASRGECVKWFSQARALIHSAFPFREPMGLAPVECMLCGTPVLASNNGALRETVKEGISGQLLQNPGELTTWLGNSHDDKPWTQEQASRCREWAKQFSVERMCERYEDLCLEAVRSGW